MYSILVRYAKCLSNIAIINILTIVYLTVLFFLRQKNRYFCMKLAVYFIIVSIFCWCICILQSCLLPFTVYIESVCSCIVLYSGIYYIFYKFYTNYIIVYKLVSDTCNGFSQNIFCVQDDRKVIFMSKS